LLLELLEVVVVGVLPLPLPELPFPELPFPELPFPELLVLELPPELPFPLPPALLVELVVGAVATVGGSVVEVAVGAAVVDVPPVDVVPVDVGVGLPPPATDTDAVDPAEGTCVGDAFEPACCPVASVPERATVAVVPDPVERTGTVDITSASFACTGGCAGAAATTPAVTTEAAPTAAAAAAGAAALPAAAANWPAMDSAWARNGNCSRKDSGPIPHINLGRLTARNARTTSGSKCAPAQSMSSLRAALALIGFLYERAAVMVSYESATATIRPASVICSAAS
jgi:hypothetical protein